MGGEGSGRLPEQVSISEVLMSDAQFAENVRIKTVQDYNSIVAEMVQIATGKSHDYVFDSKSGTLIRRAASLADRVKAAKVWKELTLDKIIADKKNSDGEQGDLLDHLETLNAVAAAVQEHKKMKICQAEQQAAESGKLTHIGAGG